MQGHFTPHTKESKRKMSETRIQGIQSGRIKSVWKDKTFSEEHKKNLSESHKGKPSPRKGVILSAETKLKMSLSKKGISSWNKGRHMLINNALEMWRKNGGQPWNKGKAFSQIAGVKNSNWKGGKTPFNLKIRNSLEIKLWRKAVFERDDYRCMDCGERGCILQADHILQFSKYPRLRFEVLNGQTLCKPCHKQKTKFERTGIYTI